MKIAQVSPLYESVPPQNYGGTERVVSYLTEELVREGHQVTLYASGDSVTQARLVPMCARSLRLDPHAVDHLAHHMIMVSRVLRDSHQYDIIHFHIDYLHYPPSSCLHLPQLTTLHGRLDLPDLEPLYQEFAKVPVVSISDAQRRPLPWANWQGTVYHGLPIDSHTFRAKPGEYLAFLGRVSPEKGLDRAIAIAQRTGIPLKVAAKVDKNDYQYFKEKIEPLLADPLVEFLGEIGGETKDRFLGAALALLFPIDWPEPFGLVMIESLACGTPVIAWRNGSVPEIIEDGVTGFIVASLEEAVTALARVGTLSRLQCRASFEERFSAARMTRDYLRLYRRLLLPTEGPRKRRPFREKSHRQPQPESALVRQPHASWKA
jgi:glycosyltransferase involved in cell wall biosynthesis